MNQIKISTRLGILIVALLFVLLAVGWVEQGGAMVDQAGVTMQEVVTSIRRVTDIMGEISAATREQSERAGQQNAALVEGIAAAAAILNGQELELSEVVKTFRVGAG